MCWSTAIKKIQHCTRQSTLHGFSSKMSLEVIIVADEMCRNVIQSIGRSCCHQSYLPCQEISSFQDLPVYRRSVLFFSSDFFGGIAFGTNVFLYCHTDADFTMNISQIFLKGKDVYHLDDDIILYFCFPTSGVAVPLRPGNYFMFNALIPHCISSRCKLEDNVMCVSFHLKTAIVGMNDNNLSLTPKHSAIIHQLHSSKNK